MGANSASEYVLSIYTMPFLILGTHFVNVVVIWRWSKNFTGNYND